MNNDTSYLNKNKKSSIQLLTLLCPKPVKNKAAVLLAVSCTSLTAADWLTKVRES